ncbi:MAG TPA: hypothetical protein VLN45_01385 [Ignavibacteriaceae bacterium]|nr:hypothetical protein [Ignavibacteriaceae bacterium]
MGNLKSFRFVILRIGLISLFGFSIFTVCAKSDNSDQSKMKAGTMITGQNEFSDSLDACSLISKEEVEKVIGQKLLEPKGEQAANLYTCTFNDPESPIFQIVGVSIIVTTDNIQAKEILSIGRKNAASVENVKDLGEDAYWDKILRTLWIVKDKYEISIDVTEDAGGFDSAKKLAIMILDRLPNS